jgi:hypothetical protein
MDWQVVMLTIGLCFVVLGCYLRIFVNTEDGVAFIMTGEYLTIVWLIDASFRLKREVKRLRKEIEELKVNQTNESP